MESIFPIGPYAIFEQRRSNKRCTIPPSPESRPTRCLMDQPFDIFKREPGGRFVWCEAAKSLAEANATVKRLDDRKSEFMVVDEDTGERTMVKPQPPLPKTA